MATNKRRRMTITVVLSVAPGITKAEAVREVRTRVNQLACYSCHIEEEDVRIRQIDHRIGRKLPYNFGEKAR